MEMNYNDVELHQIEEELHTELIPGTEIMTDVGTHHFVKGTHGVLVPQPSDSPHDPLNWAVKWKTAAIIVSMWSTFTQGFGPLALASAFPYYMAAFDCTLADAIRFTGVSILVLGFSNFIWVPISTSFGRRPVYLASQLINLGSMIWRARANTYGSFMGACVLNGIGAGPAETLGPAVIADIYFLHDRGFWNTVYWVVYMGSLMVAPIINGAMAQYTGWRSFWWLNVAMVAIGILMVIFLFPETQWHRLHPDEIGSNHQPAGVSSPADSTEKVQGREEIEVKIGAHLEPVPTHGTMPDLGPTETALRDPYLGKGYPARSQFKLLQIGATPIKSIGLDLWIPWKLFSFPIVLFAAFVVTWSCGVFLTINLTQSEVFAAPPYLFSSIKIGNFNIAILIGAFIGLATAGPFSDWVSAKATRANGGIREPEMRLLAMIPYVIIMYVGNTIVCVGYERQWDWKVIVIIGYTCAGIQVAGLPAIANTYAVDSYKPVAGSLMVAITVIKNVWGYGYSVFITPWILESGYIPPIMTHGSLALLWCLFGIVFYFYGKKFRRISRNSSVHRM